MKKVLKVLSVLFVLSLLFAVMALPSSAATNDLNTTVSVTYEIGDGIDDFERNAYVDGGAGIIRMHYNRFLFDEVGVDTFHSMNRHYGIVLFDDKTNSTNIALGGEWTNRADVRVNHNGTARYDIVF